MSNAEQGKSTDELEELELVVDLADDEKVVEETDGRAGGDEPRADSDGDSRSEARRKEEVRLNREQTLQDLRELQDLTIERASGRSSDLE